MFKKFITILTLSALCVSLVACGSKTENISITNNGSNKNNYSENTSSTIETQQKNILTESDFEGIYYADITIKNYGTISLELDADVAPIAVKNFVDLANSGFYNGLTFHRIMSGFMIQGGDPAGNGTGGSNQYIKGEFKANGVENNISHVRGVISMARQGENPYTGEKNYDSATSQFFIVHEDSPFLDGNYAAFGKVISGIEVVDAICATAQPTDNNGTIPAAKQPVIETITITNK